MLALRGVGEGHWGYIRTCTCTNTQKWFLEWCQIVADTEKYA